MKKENVQEIQFLEQGLQNILFQKQAFNMELSETNDALKELETAGDEVFKVIGQIMIKSDKSKMKEEMLSKIKIFELRMKELEKQETSISGRIEQIRDNALNNSK
jgi:prefoldin beta subunit